MAVLGQLDSIPFGCSAFPGASQCQSDFPSWIEYAYEHLVIALGGCDFVCIDLSFQHGVAELALGVGLLGVGGGIRWRTAEVHDKGSIVADICFAVDVGACVGIMPRVNEDGYWTGVTYEVGIEFGVAETEPFIGYSVGSFDFNTGKWEGPKNPVPAQLDRWFMAHCKQMGLC